MYRYISELGFRTPAIINSLKIFIRDFKDVPSVSVTKLNSEQIYSALEIHSLPWKTSSDSSKLTKEFKFNSFKETFAFMGSISTIADEMHRNIFKSIIIRLSKMDIKRKCSYCRDDNTRMLRCFCKRHSISLCYGIIVK